MRSLRFSAGAICTAYALSACTAGQTGPPTQTTVNPVAAGQSVLRLAVGTANVAGTAGLGLNVVATLRNPHGQSAVNVNTPRLTGPFRLPAAQAPAAPFYPYAAVGQTPYDANSTANVGPSALEVAGAFIGASVQPQAGVTSGPNSTFGTSGGVFGNGFDPGNYGTSGVPASFYPYYQPFYAGSPYTTAGSVNVASNAFLPAGGPPAFDPAGNGHGATGANFPAGGPSLGINAFAAVTPAAGTYTLAVAVPTTGATLTITPGAATLANPTLTLPFATALGALPAVAFDGLGNVTVTNIVIGGGVTGAYVELTDFGATDMTLATAVTGCNGASLATPVSYTAWVTTSGTVAFANANAPLGTLSAVCTAAQNAAAAGGTDTLSGDQIEVVAIGFDYNEYSLQYNGRTGAAYPQSPALPAQADISVSPAAWTTSP